MDIARKINRKTFRLFLRPILTFHNQTARTQKYILRKIITAARFSGSGELFGESLFQEMRQFSAAWAQSPCRRLCFRATADPGLSASEAALCLAGSHPNGSGKIHMTEETMISPRPPQ